jgi:hypothetical protein
MAASKIIIRQAGARRAAFSLTPYMLSRIQAGMQ